MVIHKKTKLTPEQRKELAHDYFKHHMRKCDLIRKYRVSAPTVNKILARAKHRDYTIHTSINKRFQCLQYGLKRLTKIEISLQARLKQQAKRYNKSYPGEMMHFDTKRLPLLVGESPKDTREYLFVAVDDFSRELFAAILPDKTQYSSKRFLQQVLDECAYTVETAYSDNGLEYKGHLENHAFMKLCQENKIEQRFTKVKTPQTNGKAERMIRTLMEMWHAKTVFKGRKHRKVELIRFVNWYNTVKPHKGINGMTPMEKLVQYFYPETL